MFPTVVAMLLLAGAADAGGGAISPAEALRLTLYVGPLASFGSDATAGTAPFAQLRTVTRLSAASNPPRLITRTELTAAPGSDFELADPGLLRAVSFDVGFAWAPRGWNAGAYIGCGATARALAGEDDTPAPAQTRCVVGILIESGPRAHLTLTGGIDERAPSRYGLQVEASVDLGAGLALVGGLIKSHGVTVTLAACKAWGNR